MNEEETTYRYQQKKCFHYSDCAIYNEPAMPKGECDCGYWERRAIEFAKAWVNWKE